MRDTAASGIAAAGSRSSRHRTAHEAMVFDADFMALNRTGRMSTPQRQLLRSTTHVPLAWAILMGAITFAALLQYRQADGGAGGAALLCALLAVYFLSRAYLEEWDVISGGCFTVTAECQLFQATTTSRGGTQALGEELHLGDLAFSLDDVQAQSVGPLRGHTVSAYVSRHSHVLLNLDAAE